MKNIGVIFEIPNEYGNYLYDILEPLPVDCYEWLIDNDEIYLLNDNEFTNEFLFDEDRILSGEKLYERSKNNTYYMIFVTLRGFFKEGIIKAVSKYNEFWKVIVKLYLQYMTVPMLYFGVRIVN